SRVPIVVARVMPVIVAPVVPAVVITLDTVVGPGMDIPPTIVGVVRVVMIGMAHQPRVTQRFRTLDIGGSDTREAEPDHRGTRQENVSQFHCDLLRGWSVAEAGESGWLHSNRRNATLVPDVKTAKNTAHLPAGEKARAVRMTTPIISLMAREWKLSQAGEEPPARQVYRGLFCPEGAIIGDRSVARDDGMLPVRVAKRVERKGVEPSTSALRKRSG